MLTHSVADVSDTWLSGGGFLFRFSYDFSKVIAHGLSTHFSVSSSLRNKFID